MTPEEIKAEQDYQALLQKRLEALAIQKRLQADIDAATKPRLTAEQQYQKTLKDRLDAMKEQKRLQADIDAATKPRLNDEQKYQQVLQQRLRALAQQKRLEDDIRKATTPVHTYREQVQMRLRELQERRATARDEARMAADVRAADLRARYGQRLGGALAGAERFGQSRVGQALGGAATAFGAFAGNAARSGFQGTVEGNRLSFEWQLLNREFASAFKPVIELFTAGVSKVRRFMEGLDGSGQRMVMIAGLLTGAYGSLRVLRTVGGALGAAGGGAGSLLGLGGAAAGTGAAALAGRGAGPAVVPAGGGGMGGAARFGIYAAPLFDAERGYTIGGNALKAMRAKTAEEKVGAGAEMLRDIKQNGGAFAGLGIDRMILDSGYAKRKLAEGGIDLDKPGGKTPRDQITPDQFGFEEVGSSYKRASISFLSHQAAGAEEASRKKAEEEAAGGKGIDSTAPAAMIEKGFANLLEFLHGAVGQLTRPPAN